ncbi:choice-of-anchor G family protein, partial [Georgenia alba]
MAAGTATTLAVAGYGAPAFAVDNYPEEPSEAEASVVDSSVLGTDLAGGGRSDAGSASNPGPNNEALNVDLLGSELIQLGDIELPIDQFIDFGQVGALQSESEASGPLDARAISGLASGDGSVTLDGADADFGAAEVDLLTLFNELGVDGGTDLLVDEATLLLGAGGAEVVAESGEFIDQDGVGGAGQYRVAEASLLLHSPAIEEAAGMMYDAAGQVDATMEDTVNDMLDLSDIVNALPAGVTVDATVESNMQEEIFQALVAEPITTNNEVLTVDFSTGTATLHLDQIVSGDLRPGQPSGINNQNPNTELIDDELYPMIAETVHDLMEEATNIAVGAIEGALGSVTVNLTAAMDSPAGSATATWDLNLMGDLDNVECESSGLGGGALCTTLTTAINALGPVLSGVVQPIRDFVLSDAGQEIFDVLINDIKTGAITVPIRQALEPFIELLAQVVSLQLNRQVTEVCTLPDGTETTGSLEVSAISLGLVQAADAGRLNLGNAGARIDACGLAGGELGLTLDPTEVEPGQSTTATGEGFTADSTATVQLIGPDGEPVGDPITVDTDADGEFTTDVPVPADAPPGDYLVEATDDTTGDVIEADLVVIEQSGLDLNLGLDPPTVPAGEPTTVTGEGYTPDSTATVQLVDPAGNPVGDPVPAETDADGSFTVDLPVPVEAEPGDYTVVGTDDTTGESTDAALAVYSPTLEADSPVAGDQCVAITSGGWLPESEVTLQLTDGDGNAVGEPVVVTTDGEGSVPADTCLEVPEGTEPGDYTVVGTDDGGAEVTAPVAVYVPTLEATSPVPAGGETEVTSGGWLPESEVALQLADAAGDPVGEPVTVTTDGEGNVPAGTTIPIPEDAAPGEYTVVGTDPDGATAEGTLEVYGPTLDATSPVIAGQCSVITSGGWLPESEVALQLTDAAGDPVGEPVTVTTDGEGNVPADTCLEVPEGTEPGDYTVVGTDDGGSEVSAPVEVVAAPTEPTIVASTPVPAGGET